MAELNNKTRKKFIKHVLKKIREKISGSNADRVYGDKPQVQFFIGTLCSQDPTSSLGGIRTKVAPVRMGLSFLIDKKDIENTVLKIKPKASVFYRVIPEYNEQFKAAMMRNDCSKEELLELCKEQSLLAEKGEEKENLGEKPIFVFKKYKMIEKTVSCPLRKVVGDNSEGKAELPEIQELADDAIISYNDDEKIYRPKRRKKEEMDSRVPLSALVSEEAYKSYMQSWGEKDLKPAWSVKMEIECVEFNESKTKVSVYLENTCDTKENEHIDNFLFDVNLHVQAEGGKIQNFVIDYLNDEYKYDGNMGAVGTNCEAVRDEATNSVYSEYLPFFEQPRIKPNDRIKPRFDELSTDKCSAVLENISSDMKNYLQSYNKIETEFKFRSEKGKKKFLADKQAFENEISRFEEGIKVLEKYPLAMKAFKYMNETFANAGKSKATDKKYISWRVFQIVFIVSNILDVISTEYKDVESHLERVDVLYFPTGGGKTESYLGLAVFTLFFDRLRGKKFGVSVLTKFPLRLLSLQQIQRIANILAQAEMIRRSNRELNYDGSEPFSLGYYVGDRNTPNKLMSKSSIFGGEDKDLLTPIADQAEKIKKGELDIFSEDLNGRKYLIISKCPFCGSKKVMVDADVQKIRLIHKCMNDECGEEELPIYVSDMEIYRYLPTFIISTLDKIAICGLQKNFRNLFGQVTHKCPMHGYSNSEECTEKWLCKVDKSKMEPVSAYDPVPTMQNQDELHLVRESLGTYDSHYETFLEAYEKRLNKGRRSMKLLAATATISEYKSQIDHLYCRDSLLFPSQGPKISESFYSKADNEDMNRLIVGISPHYKTMIFSVLALIEVYHELICTYEISPSKLLSEVDLDITEEQVKEMLEDYKIKLSYHLAKNDGDSISSSIRTMTNRALRSSNLPEIKPATLTGDISFNDVRIVLDKMENPKAHEDALDLIIATSMISHGVDIDKLNFMIFMGMPHNTAEYIQASSRVGRSFPGLVFVLFNPTRERDQSYYKFFTKFHEYKDLLVEAVPINRWAKFSINRTIPGIFTASVLNYYDAEATPVLHKSINMSKQFAKAMDNVFSKEDIKDMLMESYKVSKDKIGFDFDKTISEKVDTFSFEICQTLGNEFITNPMSSKPMTSLRDVDELIDINLSPEGMVALRDIKAARTDAFEEEDEEYSDVSSSSSDNGGDN